YKSSDDRVLLAQQRVRELWHELEPTIHTRNERTSRDDLLTRIHAHVTLHLYQTATVPDDEQTVDDDKPAWDRMFALNLTTALNASRAALPYLKASSEGRIVNIGSAAALKAGAGMGAYAASKSAVHRLTEALAEELKATSVTANAVLPSIIDTPQNRKDMPDVDPAKWVAPSDLAAVILFLASPASRAITGALVPVTGRV
ncbi:MAG: SDR family NAD(P)-dependent oxidoreductase, partial [Brevundimonas sp.]